MMITTRARAYVNHGRWIADCPAECGSALALQPHDTTYHCRECKTLSAIEWPKDPDGIWEALMRRPFARNRNWFPEGHDLALRGGMPHGQTVKDLDDETESHGG